MISAFQDLTTFYEVGCGYLQSSLGESLHRPKESDLPHMPADPLDPRG